MRMKTKMILFIVFVLLLAIGGVSCEREKELNCYTGTIISLNERGNACNDIVKIEKGREDGLPVGTTLAFDKRVFDKSLELGETIRFKIINYEIWKGPASATCLWPYYIATIEACNN